MKRELSVVLGALAAAPVVGYALWRRASSGIERTILARSGRARPDGAGGNVSAEHVSAEHVRGLPEPVQRFFQRTLPAGQRFIRTARFEQQGEFFMNGRWRPLRAEQVFSATPPAFMWDARISMAPLLPVYVRDSYVGRRASMRAAVLGLYRVVDETGRAELNAGALMRYLGEAAWFPTRLLPGAGLSWEPLDAHAATATLTDGATTVSLQFHFNEDGDIVAIYSPERFREEKGSYVRTPWRVRALGHEVHHGIRLMSAAEAEWLLPDGPLPYWRGRITRAQFMV